MLREKWWTHQQHLKDYLKSFTHLKWTNTRLKDYTTHQQSKFLLPITFKDNWIKHHERKNESQFKEIISSAIVSFKKSNTKWSIYEIILAVHFLQKSDNWFFECCERPLMHIPWIAICIFLLTQSSNFIEKWEILLLCNIYEYDFLINSFICKGH